MIQKPESPDSSYIVDLFTPELLEEKRANRVWLINNTKECPHCKVSIERGDGCDSMSCSRCDSSFSWSHSVKKDVDKELAEASKDAAEDFQRRWTYTVLYYRKLLQKEHELLQRHEAIRNRLGEYFDDTATRIRETKFLEEAIQRLLLARRVLLSTCVYFEIYSGPRSIIRPFLTSHHLLERETKVLSQMLDKIHLTTMKRDAIRQSNVVQKKSAMLLTEIWKYLKPPPKDESSDLLNFVPRNIHKDILSPVNSGFKPRQDSLSQNLWPNTRDRWKMSETNSTSSYGKLPRTNSFGAGSEKRVFVGYHKKWNALKRDSVSSDMSEMCAFIGGVLNDSDARTVSHDEPLQENDQTGGMSKERNVISVPNGQEKTGCRVAVMEFPEHDDVILEKEGNSREGNGLTNFLEYATRALGLTGVDDKPSATPSKHGAEKWFVNPLLSLGEIPDKGFQTKLLYPQHRWKQSSLLNRPHIGKVTVPAESSWALNAHYV